MILRDKRRTTVITIGPDVIRVCEPECRNYFLSDLGIPAGRNEWKYRPSGEADVHVAWSGKDYRVTWKRCKPSAIYCDQCGDEWQGYIPASVAKAQAQSERLKGSSPPEFTPFPALRAS
jgi:hypothetical protein